MKKRFSISVAALLLLSGCANLRTEKSHYAGISSLLARADYPAAIARIEAVKTTAYTHKDRVVYYLDTGMLYHWNGQYAKSNEMLELAERAIQENVTKSLSRSASSLILNDNVLAYDGEDYENIYLNVFKALNYLALGQNDDAFVEVRRINNKLAELESKYDVIADKLNEAEESHTPFVAGKNRFQESALGRYLSMLLYRNEQKWDDVRIDLEKIERSWKLQPGIHPFPLPDFTDATQHLHPPEARLNIIAFSGQAPQKKADTFYIHSEENLIILGASSENYLGKQDLIALNAIPWPDITAGYHFKLQLPHMEKARRRVAYIEVVANGRPADKLQPLESLENAAVETFAIRKPIIFLKTITRAVIKGLAAEQAKQQMIEKMDGHAAFFTRLATDLLIDTIENADLRISRFFPAEAAVCELHLNEGIYDIRVNYYGPGGALLHSDEHPGQIIGANRLNVLESVYLN